MKTLLIKLIPFIFLIIGCKINEPSPQDVAHFYVDITENKTEDVQKAIQRYPKIKYWTFDVGNDLSTPLDVAIYKGNDDIVKLIADEHNATISFEPYYQTPLMFALEMGRSTECIKYLMSFDQKYDVVDYQNNNIIHFFVKNKTMNIKTWNLIKSKITPDMINQRNDNNLSPIQRLIWTVLSEEIYDTEVPLTIFNDLLELGANTNDLFERITFEEYKNFPYMELLLAYFYNSYIEVLLNHLSGPLPDYGNYSSYANVAYHHNNFEIIPKLIPYLKDINLCTKKNETILHWAAASTAKKITDYNLIKLLIESGADTSIISVDGYTAYSVYKELSENPDEEILNLLRFKK